jgi:hypothetical protein
MLRPITRTRPARLHHPSALIDARLCRLTVTTVFVVTLLLVMLRWLLDRRRIRRVGMIKELETADLHTEDGEELVQRMFTEFDEDASGRMSISEAAKFMRTWQPGLSKRTAYAAARDHASDDGLGFGLFLQLLVEQQQALEEKRSLRLSSADSKPSTFGLALESAASASGLALESVASAASSAATAVSTSAASAASSASGSERLRSPLSCQAESTSQVVLEASE